MNLSIVIPVYNEEKIIKSAVDNLTGTVKSRFPDLDFEILLMENGSADNTPQLVDQLESEYSQVRAFHNSNPDYGRALRRGILEARGEFVVGDEIDLGDVDFYEKGFKLLEDPAVQMVIGSKALPASADKRPLLRRAATRGINFLLRLVLGFQGTDTHGLKIFRRSSLLPVVEECVIGKDLFASEFVIRAQRHGILTLEIPVMLHEKRPPAINLLKRVPGVLKGLWILHKNLGPRSQ
ncbi:MAG: glycosyltransferase [Deltaproteobacteria bacterium]|jgi:glycosyltransferase involved in cell wall biosynthesis|nr:glycosyltransferase [Deltaproteobacteria bacterium]